MEPGVKRSGLPSWLRTMTIGRSPRWTLIRILILVVVVFLVRAFVLLPIMVKGPSMLPTYQSTGLNFVYRLAYLSSRPQRGDVVAIRYSGEHIMLMKRVIGLPGETVMFHQGHVFINGSLLEEPYLKNPSDWERAPDALGPHEYFVVGDNRSMPIEDHRFGKAEDYRIVGKVLLCKNLFASWLQ
jgi:signal peptidase I